MAIKPSDITKEMVEERSKIIIEALIENNTLKLNLAIKQLANWSAAKRKQVFRKTFLQLIGGRQYWQPLARTLKANYYVDYWASPLDITMNTLLERFVSEIRKLEETSRFIPEKVLTLSSVSLRILNMDANTFKYLIDKKIWIIGNSLKLTSFQQHNVVNDVHALGWTFREHTRFFNFIKDKNFDLDLFTDPIKFSTVLFYNEFHNISTIANVLLEKAENNRTLTTILNLEKIAKKCQSVVKDLQLNMRKEFRDRIDIKKYNSFLNERDKMGLNEGLKREDVAKILQEITIEYLKLNQKINTFLYSEQPVILETAEKEDIFDPVGKSFSAV
jgi:hypothetical protein